MNLTSLPVLIVIVALGAIGLLAGLVVMLMGRGQVNERLSEYVEKSATARPYAGVQGESRLTSFRHQLNKTLSAINSEELQIKLSSANWQISASEYYLMRFIGTFAAMVLGSVIFDTIFGGIILGGLTYLIPGALLLSRVQKRQRQFQDQLVDTLTLIKGAVKAGSSFLQSLDVVISEMANPTGEEFRRVRREVELGLPLGQALNNLALRMESDDLYIVVTAININLQVGGNLTDILETVTETVRSRIFLFSEIRSLTSYVRYTSYLLTLLPFITALLLILITPFYFEALLRPGITRYILIYAVVSLIVGNIVLRRVGRIKV